VQISIEISIREMGMNAQDIGFREFGYEFCGKNLRI